MNNIGVFYGSSTGHTATVARSIARLLSVPKEDVFDLSNKNVLEKFNNYQILILGSSTWSDGDIEDDWDLSWLESQDLKGKKIAVFGTGDSISYPDSFCDALALLAAAAQKAGGLLIGNKVEIKDYTFDASISVIDGYLIGLAIDEDNEPELTEERIEKWVDQLRDILISKK